MFGKTNRKIKLKYKKERAILSDTLPYEIPITFSNRNYYAFLLKNKIEIINSELVWKSDDDALDEVIKLLFFDNKNEQIISFCKNINGRMIDFKKITNFSGEKLITIPFKFKINHNKIHRELTLCHPRNQLALIDFYNQFKELIIYYCNQSPFSIRKPCRVSKYIYYKDRTHYDLLNEDFQGIEQNNQEYESLKSFFVYKDYSNIHKFYESKEYLRCEQKFNELTKLDITKCFDSIYTHTLAWALINKESVKANIKYSKNTFPGIFDRFMQQLNYNETNGIIIGPEFSRIFAELILQSVDNDVFTQIKDKLGLAYKKDYIIFRYVDDYFIFYNEVNCKDKIVEQIQISLKKYNLYLNESKITTYTKPIITEITIAKQGISELLESSLSYQIQECESDDLVYKKGYIYIDSKKTIVQFKKIIKESNVEYKDIMNYSLAIFERKSLKIVKDHNSLDSKYRSEKQLLTSIRALLNIVFFIYSVSPLVNTTIKLARILRIYISYFKGKDINPDFKHIIFKDIFDNLIFILEKNRASEHIQIETLYLLISLSELGKYYWIDEPRLAQIFGLELDNQDYSSLYQLNYFSITVLLFYIKNKTRYIKIKKVIENEILKKFENNKASIKIDSELIFLLMDIIACPYVSQEAKYKIFDFYDISNVDMKNNIIKKFRHFFTTWDNFDFGKALDAKQSQEVY